MIVSPAILKWQRPRLTTPGPEQGFEEFLAERSLDVARVAAPVYAVLFGIIAWGFQRILPGEAASTMVPLAVGTVALGVMASLVVKQPDVCPCLGRVALALMTGLASVNVLTHLAITGRPLNSFNVAALLVCLGLVLHARIEAYVVSAVSVSGWLFVALPYGLHGRWLRGGFAVLAAAAVFVIAFESRRSTYGRLLQQQVDLLKRAQTDQLTGLANRSLVASRIEESLARNKRRPDYGFGVCFLDLNHFKAINDRHGHAAGDRVLRSVASLLESHCRTNDVPARIGGDEFVVLLDDIPNEGALQNAVGRLRELLGHEADLEGGVTIAVSVAAGGVWSGAGFGHAEDILTAADRAMYEDKRSQELALPRA